MLTCEQATRLISDGMERPLGWRERAGLRVHLWICTGCTNFVRQTQLLRQLARRYARGDVPGRRTPAEDQRDVQTPDDGA